MVIRNKAYIGVAAAVLFAILASLTHLFGLPGPFSMATANSDAMAPKYSDGELLVLHSQQYYNIGQTVEYHVSTGADLGSLGLSMITGGDSTKGFNLRAEANNHDDASLPKSGEIVGMVVFAVPGMGTPLIIAVWVLMALALLTVIGMTAMGVWETWL
jgi:hypothetical protein